MGQTTNELSLKVRDVVLLALTNLGLNESFLIDALKSRKIELHIVNGLIDYSHLPLDDYIWLCSFLFIPIEWTRSIEWAKTFQIKSAGEALFEGRYTLPKTESTRILLKSFIEQEKKEIRFKNKIYGSPLLEKIILTRRRELKNRRLNRKRNLSKLSEQRNYWNNVYEKTAGPMSLKLALSSTKELVQSIST